MKRTVDGRERGVLDMDKREEKMRGGKDEEVEVVAGDEVRRGRCIIGKDRRGEGEGKGLLVLTQWRVREKTHSGTGENVE